MKAYNEFYSPVEGDTEEFNKLTIGGAKDLIDNMYANGIDPFKSPEARAAISRYINSVDTKTINGLRQNAEERRIYDQNKAKLISEGRFNQALEDQILEDLGLKDFKTVGPGGEINRWGRLSPVINKTMKEFAIPEISKFGKDEYLGKGSRPFTNLYGVSEDNVNAAIDATIRSVDNSDYGRYYRKLAEDQVRSQAGDTYLTPEEFQKQVDLQYRSNVRQEMTDYLQPKEVEDNIGLTMYKIQQEQLENARNRAFQAEQKRLDRQAATNAAGDKTGRAGGGLQTPLSQQIIQATVAGKGAWTNAAYGDLSIYRGMTYQDLVKASKNDNLRSKMIKDGLIDVSKDGKKWSLNPNNDKVKQLLALNKKYAPYEQLKNKTYSSIEFGNILSNHYNRFVNFEGTSEQVNNTLNGVFNSGATKVDDEYKTTVVSSRSNNFRFSTARQAKVAGVYNMAPGLIKEFDKYLRSHDVQLYSEGGSKKAAGIQKSNGEYSIDVSGNVKILEDDLGKIAKNLGYGNAKKLSKALGLKESSIKYKKGTNSYSTKVSYIIPMIKTIGYQDANTTEIISMDNAYNAAVFGQGAANSNGPHVEDVDFGNVPYWLLNQ